MINDQITITIVADATAAQRAFDQAIFQAARLVEKFAPVLWEISLARQRDRSRLVTRRKQRRSW